jgi:hypothetical protein
MDLHILNLSKSYSNGFGPFTGSVTWFTIYWTSACVVIGLIAYNLFIRGREYGFRKRMKTSMLLPRIYKVNFTIDLMPCQRSMTAGIDAWVRNISDSTISELHFTNPVLSDNIRVFSLVTPDSLQYLFGDEYEVTIRTSSEKFRSDTLATETAIPVNDYIDVGVFAEPTNKNNLSAVLQAFNHYV